MAAELIMYAPIGADLWGDGITSSSVARVLRNLRKDEEVTVRLNSPGGDAFEGIAIYNALVRHEGKVTVEVDALAASAASIIAMAGDEIRMATGALIMIHEAWGLAMGPAEDHEKAAGLLRKLNDEMAAIYAARTKLDDKKLLRMMAEETWMNSQDALDNGFCEQVHAAKGAPDQPKEEAERQDKAAASLIGKYKRAPSALRSHPGSQFARYVQEHDEVRGLRATAPRHEPPPAPKRPAALRMPLGELGKTPTARLGDR